MKDEGAISKHKGVLLAFEGISGSGKSEGISKLSGRFRAQGFTVTVVEWNSNQTIRFAVKWLDRCKLLTPVVYSVFQWISFFIDYLTLITPALRKGHIVIADRYVYTALTRDAVNGSGRMLGRVLSRLARKPDLLLLYDTPPEICYERIKTRGKALFHPNKAIHRNKNLQNKELYYLQRMRDEYYHVLSKSDIEQGANFISIEHYN